jgi:putative transposase
MDFIVDGLATGRMVRILSVVDVYTRECLALEADTSLGSGRVTRVLERLIEERGRPEAMRSDNGPEFCSRRLLGWAEEFKVELVHIQPGRPLTGSALCTMVRSTLATWREEYNCERPHSSLDYRAHHKSSARYWKGAGPWPCSLPKPKPSTQPRISSYDWMRKPGQVK